MKTKTNTFGLVLVVAGLTVLTGCKKEPETVFLPLLAATNAIEITVNDAVINGTVLRHGTTGVTARGFCWSTSPFPDISDSKMTEGKGIGEFTARITGLLPGTDYYVSAWATNAEGTSYGTPRMFRTPLTTTPATLETLAFEYMSGIGALSGGDITDIGGGEVTEKGIVWSTDPSPTIENLKAVAPASLISSGRFTIVLTSLVPGKTYYLRAYAINSAGVSYGPEINFKAPASLGIRKAEFPGEARSYSVTFSIENKIYVGLGFMQNGFSDWPLGDFWAWDQSTNQWNMLAEFPGINYDAIGFAIGGKGYVFTSGWYNSETGYYPSVLWEYEPETDQWTKKSNFPSNGYRSYPVAFSIGSKVYIGLGRGASEGGVAGFYKDLWEWDQGTNVWTRKADFPGQGRSGAATFAIGKSGYVGTGITSGGWVADFWEYDQQEDRWTRKVDYPGNPRSQAVGFAIGTKGYLGAGYHESAMDDGISQDFWEYDQVTEKWDIFGTVAATGYIWAGGSVSGNGYFLANAAVAESQTAELWTFPLTSDK